MSTALPDLYPVNLVLAGRRCLVVGGGLVAARKVSGLLGCGAVVHVVATWLSPELAELEGPTTEQRPYRRGEVSGYRLVITATGDPETNRAVHEDAERAGVWVNAADDVESCSFTLPAVVRQGPVVVSVSSSGRSPALASWLAERIREQLGPEHALAAGMLSAARERCKALGRSTETVDWRSALDSDMLGMLRAGQVDRAEELLRRCLSSS
ncbi:MAG: precorrin-2 dehydrogenase/sirohydrochlorin ferrochelatase family protein [Acidimicrobiales bacterium]